MDNIVLHEEYPECTDRCKSIKHGDIITSVITRRCVTDNDLCSYINYTCKNCENVRDSVGRTVIHLAVSCGRLDLVRWLINKRHININLKDTESGWTPLHRCLFYGQIHIGIELIKLGANINLLDNDNLTGLEHLMKDGYIPSTNDDDCYGEVYYWGTNVNNILGAKESRTVPEFLDIFHKNYPNEYVREILIEKFHCVILTRSNRLYSCGHGHGGRLGLGHQKPIIIPELIKIPDDNLNCLQIAIAQDHSLFLCQDSYVYTCGLNTYKQLGVNQQQVLKPTLIKQFPNSLHGVCCGHYHSCVWGRNFVYTWGLNGGQLGHKNRTEKYVQQPELINIINLNDIEIKLVNCSDAAISIYTGKGDIYIVHEYQCRKVASKQLNLIQIDVIGGKLNQKLFNKDDTTFTNTELKVIVLTNTGNLMLWQENDQQLLRCIYSINRTIIVKQVKLNLNGLLFVTKDGEAFHGSIKPRKRRNNNNNNTSTDGSFHKFLERDDCVSIKIRKFPRIHRAISIQSDPKGNDFCVIQILPYKRFKAPIIDSEIQQNLRLLLDECEENDEICDVIFEIQTIFIPAHRYILASRCEYFEKLFNDNHERIIRLDNSYNPAVFKQFLLYIYTGDCKLLHGGDLSDDFKDLCETTTRNIEDEHDYHLAIDTQSKKSVNNPTRVLYDMSKKFGCRELCDRLRNLEINKFPRRYRKDITKDRFEMKPLSFIYTSILYDVIIKCNDGEEIKAHKCVLAARSDYFKNLFSMRWHGSETSLITLPCSKHIVDGLLEFLYTDDVQFANNLNRDQDYLFKLLILADQLFILSLKKKCEFYLYECLTLKNVVQYLNFSHIYNAEQLKNCCLQFIIDNLPPLLELHQFDNLDDDLLMQLTRFYCDKKPTISCRIITPYSTAPNDEIIRTISSTYPISMDDEIDTTNRTQQSKRRSRQHRVSNSSTTVNCTKINNSNDVENIAVDDDDDDALIQFPDSTPSPSSQIVNRLKAIRSAEEKIDDQNCHQMQFTILTSSKSRRDCDIISSSFEDFPLLNSPPQWITPRTHRINSSTNSKIVRISQKQRKRLSSECSNNQEPVTVSESPKNPWKIIEPSSPSSLENCFNQIVSLEKKQKENLVKITSKSLIYTQMEDRAIEELKKFYNAINIFEEEIIIERVSLGAVAVPVWVPGVKKLE